MIANIIEHFSTLEDPRRDHPNTLHKLIDIIVITLCAILAKSETWEEIADHAEEKIDFFLLTRQHLTGCSRFKQFLELPNGIPSHDTINRTFSLISPILWQKHFASWMQTQTLESAEKIDHIQIDGKVLRAAEAPVQVNDRTKTKNPPLKSSVPGPAILPARCMVRIKKRSATRARARYR